MFSHDSDQTTEALVARFGQLLQAHRLNAVKLEQHAGPPVFFVEMGQALSIQAFTALVQFQGVRRIAPEPLILPIATASVATGGPVFTATLPGPDLPVVAVFDTGVDPGCTALKPWVKSRDIYVLPPDTNYLHGTAVSSLIIDSHGLNGGHLHFPKTSGCLIHDVCGLESSPKGSPIGDLVIRLRDAIPKRPDIKVWNLSLGGPQIGDAEFSWFGRELDKLSDKFGVLFVVAAGNYEDIPRRGWPTTGTALQDRLSSPGDSVRALTVGAVTHLESPASLVRIGEPAPYSRRGPGPVFTPKPDIVHIGGNADVNLSPAGIGVNVLSAAGATTGCGTSYAAPIASGLAAKTWHALTAPGRSNPLTVSPAMVKALLIHSAQLNSPERDVAERRYYGAGMPGDPVAVLYDSDSSFTMLFELDIVDSMKWRKAPFPIPPSLVVDGKLKAEVIVTVAYAPPVDDSKGAEYVRFNVDVGFGRLTPNAKGKLAFHGCVPAEGEEGTNGFEQAQVEHGGKWSPIKVYRRVFKNGVAGNIWALQATLLRRAFEPPLTKPLRVVIAVTLRALDNNPNVYGEGRRVLAQSNWISQDIASRIDLPVRT